LLISAEELRYQSYLRREDTAIVKLARDGSSIKQIVHRLGQQSHSTVVAYRKIRTARYHLWKIFRLNQLLTCFLAAGERLEPQYSNGCSHASTQQPKIAPTDRMVVRNQSRFQS
jgi:hypothetical protein